MIKTEKEALTILEKMSEKKFQKFFSLLPLRTQLLLRSGLANWREVLPKWYLKFNK